MTHVLSRKDIDAAVRQRFDADTTLPGNARVRTLPRQISMYLMRRAGYSGNEIGHFFTALKHGQSKPKHHTTVFHACDVIRRRLEADPDFAQLIGELETTLFVLADSLKALTPSQQIESAIYAALKIGGIGPRTAALVKRELLLAVRETDTTPARKIVAPASTPPPGDELRGISFPVTRVEHPATERTRERAPEPRMPWPEGYSRVNHDDAARRRVAGAA